MKGFLLKLSLLLPPSRCIERSHDAWWLIRDVQAMLKFLFVVLTACLAFLASTAGVPHHSGCADRVGSMEARPD